jgi:hypothetical protein
MVFIKDRTRVYIVFSSLKSRSKDLAKSDIWVQAHSIIGVNEIFQDESDFESKIFGAETSGHTLLYDPQGNLVFSGGLTPERGHMGDSVGRDAILEWLNNQSQPLVTSAIYGCIIRKPSTSTDIKNGNNYEK